MPSKGILPQNIQTLIGEIGERQVLLQLSLRCRGTKWRVFLSLGEPGYDVLLLNQETHRELRIEVKARQRMYTTSRNPKSVGFVLTDVEHRACHFLIAYLLDDNSFYIVPKQDLKKAHSGDSVLWRFSFTVNVEGKPPEAVAKYWNAWQLIDQALDRITSDS